MLKTWIDIPCRLSYVSESNVIQAQSHAARVSRARRAGISQSVIEGRTNASMIINSWIPLARSGFVISHAFNNCVLTCPPPSLRTLAPFNALERKCVLALTCESPAIVEVFTHSRDSYACTTRARLKLKLACTIVRSKDSIRCGEYPGLRTHVQASELGIQALELIFQVLEPMFNAQNPIPIA